MHRVNGPFTAGPAAGAGPGLHRRKLLLWTFSAAAAASSTGQAASPRRIVSIGGALTETIFALGAQAQLAGVDTTSIYPPQAQSLPSVGYARTLSAEGVMSLSPSLVLATEEAGPPAVLRQLEAAGIPLKRLPVDHQFEGLLARTRALGPLLGQEEAAERLAGQLQSQWQSAQARVAGLGQGRKRPRVMFVLSHSMSQVRVAGTGTAADAMIRLAGGSNVFESIEGYKPLNAEAAIAAAPELILATDQGLAAAGGVAGLLQAPGLGLTPAGRAQRVAAMDALYLLGFGPRLPSAVATLAEALHRPAAGAG